MSFTGLPEGASKKSRSYLLLQRLPATQRGEEEEEEEHLEEEEEEDDREEDDAEEPQMETGSQISTRTQQSQLSYKPMTPQAPPLPMGLGLTREPPMVNGGRDPQEGAVEPPLVSSRPTSGQQQGSRPVSASRAPRPPSAPRPGSTTSQGRRPPSQASVHSRGKESETGPAANEEETGPAAAETAAMDVEGQQKEEGEEAPRGNEPESEQLDRQGEMQRGDERVLDDKENQEEEKEKDETEEAEKAQNSTTPVPPPDAGAGVQSRGHTPHPGEMPPRGPSAGSSHSAKERQVAAEDERAEESKAEAAEDVQAKPPVKEDKAGRGGQAEAEPEPETQKAEEPAAAEQQRPTNFTERAEDSLHVEADMKAAVGSQAAGDDTSRPPTQPGSKPASRQTNLGLGSRPPTQGSRTGSRPPTQPRGLRKK